MKYLLCLLFIFYCTTVFTQGRILVDSIRFHTQGLTEFDSTANKICKERGHVSGGVVSKTLMYCPSYLVENDSISYVVYPACNYIKYNCMRCGKLVEELEEERKVVIWRKE
jgi:hypothetical protein